MARFTFSNVDNYVAELKKLADPSTTKEIIGKAIYEGASVVANAVKASIRALPTSEGRGTSEHPINGVTRIQKAGLIDGFGVAPMKLENGYYNVKVGFDGYNRQKTKQYPNGQPNQLIARSVEAGTSFRRKHPFVAPAVRKTRKQCEETMARVVDEEIQKLIK